MVVGNENYDFIELEKVRNAILNNLTSSCPSSNSGLFRVLTNSVNQHLPIAQSTRLWWSTTIYLLLKINVHCLHKLVIIISLL